MAIFPDLPGIEVTVHMSGVAMTEYEDDEEVETHDDEIKQYQALRTISKYIESRSDQEFSIEIAVQRPYKFTTESLCFDVYIDGIWVQAPIFTKKRFLSTGDGTCKASVLGFESSDASGDVKVQKPKFAAIKTTTEMDKTDDISDQAARIDKVGEVVVWVYRAYTLSKCPAPGNDKIPAQQNLNNVHEKALKGHAKSHSALLGEKQPTSGRTFYEMKYVDGKKRPIAIFKFKYRSLGALQSLLIVPREPDVERSATPTRNSTGDISLVDTPEPASTISTANSEEQRLMAAYLITLRGGDSHGVKAENPSIKREGTPAEGRRKKIKREVSDSIDLTADDA